MAETLSPAQLVPFHKDWEWHGGVPSSAAQHLSLPSAVGHDRDRRGQHARALGDGLTACGRAQCGERLNMRMLHGQWASSAHGPLAQHFLHAQALLDLGSCTSLAAAVLVWSMCLLHPLSVPPTRTTSAGCIYFLPLLPCPQHHCGCTGRVSGWATCCPHSWHAFLPLPSLPVSCQAHTHPWQLRQQWLQAHLAGDVCPGSGTPTRVQAQSCPQVPAGRVLSCPCSTGLPQPQAAPSPPSVFFKRITFLLNTLIRLVAVCLQCC